MNSYLDDSWFFVQCNNCAVNGPEDYTAESARIAWNQRANNYGKNSD
ncbi:hypothetical protein [Xenorhabdus griffiniae]